MSGRVDFHVHSDKSCDGDFSPAELVGFAKNFGMRAISIADHDTVAAYPEAVELGRIAGVEVIPGIEITTLFGGREFHLLLPFVDWTSPALAVSP
jgi:predicted metal-dependent phosphoesterase TrpH